jgi:hypothetical protein
MRQLKDLQKKATKWRQISHELKSIYDKLDSQDKSKEEWYYKMQIKMLLSKALNFSDTYADKIKQTQEKQVSE